MREKTIEAYLVKQAKAMGMLCFKFVSPNQRGVPDRILFYNGRVCLAEMKSSDGGVVSPLQSYWLEQLRKTGITAEVLCSKEEVDKFLERFEHNG